LLHSSFYSLQVFLTSVDWWLVCQLSMANCDILLLLHNDC
jgi:hypothetical protein